MKRQEFKDRLSGKKIGVLGLGISNFPLIRFLHENGAAKIVCLDRSDKKELRDKLNELLKEVPFEYHLGDDYLDYLADDFDEIYKTPIIRYDIKELEEARNRGVLVTSEIEEFIKACPAKIYGVTGSDGKTTTTTLIYELLKRAGCKVWLGGNIGSPPLQYLFDIKEEDKVVLELSSFQLMNMICPIDVAIITNISPNHLDVHKSYEEYIDAKANILRGQDEGMLAVLNNQNKESKELVSLVHGRLRYFGIEEGEESLYLREGKIIFKGEELLDIKEIKIKGMHNIENYMAAIGAVIDDINKEDILHVARSFQGVSHRLEFVRELKGITFYNSSIDSSPNRTMNAIRVFDNKLILIAGGKDKNLSYDPLGKEIYERVKVLILTGPTGPKIEQAARDEFRRREETYYLKTIYAKNYEEAVKVAYENASSGDVILLSPASTSFDMFKNFEERGNMFKNIVNNLEN